MCVLVCKMQPFQEITVGYSVSMNLPSFRRRKIIRESSSWALFLCLLTLTLCVPVGASTTTTTINSPDGDVIDCTEILAQPSFMHTLLKDHKLQEIPRNLPNTAKNENGVSGWQIWNSRNGSKCPEGTIPIRRGLVSHQKNGSTNSSDASIFTYGHAISTSKLDIFGFGSSEQSDVSKFTRGHEYAFVYSTSEQNILNYLFGASEQKIYGTKVTMSVGHPKVEQVDEFSSGQLLLASGSHEKRDMNLIVAGWKVHPSMFSDDQSRLFIGWTNYAYTFVGCSNLRCHGFIQTSGNVLLEGAIHPHIEAITIQIWKDPNLGHWWLSVGPNSNTLIPVGYWPIEMFSTLTDHANMAQWGGQIINDFVLKENYVSQSQRHTTTQMGSGYLPNSAKAAYMRDLEIVVNKPYNLEVCETNPSYYKVKKTSKTSFTYGGPYGGPEHAGTIHVGVNLVFLYFCFSLFLLF